MMQDDLIEPRDMLRECRCLNAQREARQLARRYDAALKPVGLTSGQFAILASLNQPEPTPLSRVAEALGLERTTLTRNLQPLEDAKLVGTAPGSSDRRMRHLLLTAAGRDRLRMAMPLWREAQQAWS